MVLRHENKVASSISPGRWNIIAIDRSHAPKIFGVDYQVSKTA